MYTNPFERKHSSLRQAFDRFISETRLSFRRKAGSKAGGASGSASSVSSSSSFSSLQFKPKCNGKR